MVRWIVVVFFSLLFPFSVVAGQNCIGKGQRKTCLIVEPSEFPMSVQGFYLWKQEYQLRELMRIYVPMRSPYTLSPTVPVSYGHVRKLLDKGLSLEEIAMIGSAAARRRDAHAYRLYPERISVEDLYFLALWASITIGEDIDPRILVGIHWVEMIKRLRVGGCAFVSDKEKSVALVRGWNPSYPERIQARFKREKEAFHVIHNGINLHLRHHRYRLQPHYMLASCGAGALGPFQIMPTMWNKYENEVCGEVCSALEVGYASPYHLIPAVFGAAAILRDKAFHMKLDPSDVNLDNPEIALLVSAAYYAGPRNAEYHIDKYGKRVYESAFFALGQMPNQSQH